MDAWYLRLDRPSINLKAGERKYDPYHQWEAGPLSSLEKRIVLLLEKEQGKHSQHDQRIVFAEGDQVISAIPTREIEDTLGIPCLFALKSLQAKGFVTEHLSTRESLQEKRREKAKATLFDEVAKQASKPKWLRRLGL